MILRGSNGHATNPEWQFTAYDSGGNGVAYGQGEQVDGVKGLETSLTPSKISKEVPKEGALYSHASRSFHLPKGQIYYFWKRGAVFTKMSITRSYVVQIQIFLYEKLALLKIYNFVKEVELKFWKDRGLMIGLAEAIYD